MRYRPEHKAHTRARILAAAGRLFRRHGYEGVGIDTIMDAAGLTRGGFYAHFRSKAELFADVVAGEHDLITRLEARDGQTREHLGAQAMEVIAGYLHPNNRERVGRGCPMASLSVDVARASVRTRKAYARKLSKLAEELGRSLPDTRSRDPRALAAAALCVGGLILARASADERLANDLLAACREAVDDLLESPH